MPKIKTDDRTKTIPVVVLTSSQEDRDIKECYRLGVNSYVDKPVEFDNFARALAELGFYTAADEQAAAMILENTKPYKPF